MSPNLMDFIKNWLAILAKRVSKGAFWLEVLVALLVGGGTFWGVKALRDEGLLMGQELLHHDYCTSGRFPITAQIWSPTRTSSS